MKDWKSALIKPSSPILEAMKIIDASTLQIALVTDESLRLLGVVTDGDIRRALLRGMSSDQPVETIMNRNFCAAAPNTPEKEILAMMKKGNLRQIPILDEGGNLVDMADVYKLIQKPEMDNWVILMAGGLGTRLQPLTYECPKPLLKVGNKPLLETIIDNFISFGFRKFFLSVNYKSEMIKSYFGDGSKWDVEINYIEENQKLGTAGALGMLPHKPSKSIIVMNGDVLSKINFQHLLDFHHAHQAKATMCVKDYHFQFPYGVIQCDQHQLTGISEKPVQIMFVNAGIYVLEPELIELIPRNTCVDITDLFNVFISKRYNTVVFPIREYWMDVGKIEDFERVNGEYEEHFQ